jgi:hypothetical protein
LAIAKSLSHPDGSTTKRSDEEPAQEVTRARTRIAPLHFRHPRHHFKVAFNE